MLSFRQDTTEALAIYILTVQLHLSAMYLAQYWACHVNHRLWRGSQGSMSHAELTLTYRFWARGSYCLQLCTH